jgi:hypothetical protein
VEIIADYFKIKDASYKDSFGSCGEKDVEICVICGKPIREGCATLVGRTRLNGPVHKQCFVLKLIEDDKRGRGNIVAWFLDSAT